MNATVANTIKGQLGIATLMGLGAHQLTAYADALTLKARIMVPGTRRVRIMTVKIVLTPADLYDLSIGYLDKKTLEWHAVENHEGLYADTMVEIVRKYA